MRNSIFAIAGVVGLGMAPAAMAGTVFVGDQDCFGLGGACANGDLYRDGLGGTFFADNSTASDPAGTDIWDLGDRAYTFALGAGATGASSASLEIFYAGLELATGGDVLVNGTSVGTIQTTGAGDFQKVDTGIFSGIEGLLTASTLVEIKPSSGSDGYIIDYASISYDSAVIPLPATLPLLLSALGAAGLAARRRKG